MSSAPAFSPQHVLSAGVAPAEAARSVRGLAPKISTIWDTLPPGAAGTCL